MNILIVGYGIVGKMEYNILKLLNPDIYDIKMPEVNTKRDIKYDLVVIAVPTPYISKENSCDISMVREAINSNDGEVYVIKSTILPGSTDLLKEETGKRIVFSPEYSGNTPASYNFKYDYTVFGGSKVDCKRCIQIYQNVFDARHKFYMVSAKTAEMNKYMMNLYFCMKMSFCDEFYDKCNEIGVDYEQLRELFILDPRVSPSHTFVYDEHPFWSSHCLDKDSKAFAYGMKSKFIEDIVDYNESRKPNK